MADQKPEQDATESLEPDAVYDQDTLGVVPRAHQNPEPDDDSVLEEMWEWVKSIERSANSVLRWYIIFPAVFLSTLYIVAEVTGIEEILWTLLALLFARSIFILASWPFILTLLSFERRTSIFVRALIIEFLFELSMILIGFAVPFHILEPFFLRLAPFLCLIGVAGVILNEVLAQRKAPKNILPVWKWLFIVAMAASVLAVFDRIYELGIF